MTEKRSIYKYKSFINKDMSGSQYDFLLKEEDLLGEAESYEKDATKDKTNEGNLAMSDNDREEYREITASPPLIACKPQLCKQCQQSFRSVTAIERTNCAPRKRNCLITKELEHRIQ